MDYDRRQPTNPFNIPEYREEFGNTLVAALAPINRLVEKHEKELELVKAEQNRQKGAAKVWGVVVGSLWGLVLAGMDYMFHRKV